MDPRWKNSNSAYPLNGCILRNDAKLGSRVERSGGLKREYPRVVRTFGKLGREYIFWIIGQITYVLIIFCRETFKGWPPAPTELDELEDLQCWKISLVVVLIVLTTVWYQFYLMPDAYRGSSPRRSPDKHSRQLIFVLIRWIILRRSNNYKRMEVSFLVMTMAA